MRINWLQSKIDFLIIAMVALIYLVWKAFRLIFSGLFLLSDLPPTDQSLIDSQVIHYLRYILTLYFLVEIIKLTLPFILTGAAFYLSKHQTAAKDAVREANP